MPHFSYRALDPGGSLVEDSLERDSPAEVEKEIRSRGQRPLEIAVDADRRRGRSGSALFRAREAGVARLFRYLASLVGSGLALDRALRIAARSVGHRDVATAIEKVRRRVREGISLADGLREHPDLFPPLAVGLTSAGERGGELSGALAQAASALERRTSFRSKVQSALMYPAVMALVGGVSLLVLVLYVLPRFTELFTDAAVELPTSTGLLLAMTGFVKTWWPALLLGPVLVGFYLLRRARTNEGRLFLHRSLLRMPVVGDLRRQLVGVHVGRTLAALLQRGVPVLEALDLANEVVTDEVAKRQISGAQDAVRSGSTLHASLTDGRAFPGSFLEMVEVGEESGRLPELLKRSSDILEEDLEQGLERLVRLVEPALILVFGGIVGFVALALLQAVYGLHSGGMPG